MCGIAGILRVWPASERDRAVATPPVHAIPEAWLDILDDSIRHRGPDGHGRFRDRSVRADGCIVDVALVHRRLSILDHAGGHQPMLSLARGAGVVTGTRRLALDGGLGLYERDAASELIGAGAGDGAGANAAEGRVCVVFNGCIYNHRALRDELQRAGHVFTTDHSDTEVLVHGWREWGRELFTKLDGMYALAVWDAASAGVTFARDRCGEKPLYESLTPDGRWIIFGSTVPAVLRAGRACGFDKVTNIEDQWMLREWIRLGHSERPPTGWVHEVQPGDVRMTSARAPKGGASTTVCEIHTKPPLPDRGRTAQLDEARLDALLRRGVRSRMEADVPMGVFLSGGVDSSLIAKYAIDLTREAGGGGGRVRTFSVKMPDARFDESAIAERVAGLLGSAHTTLACAADPAADLVALIAQMGVPLGDSSLLPTAWVSRAARAHVTVAIGGDGGDELFGGYERHVANVHLNRHQRLLAAIPAALLSRADARSWRSKAARLAVAARHSGYGELVSIFPEPDARALMPGYEPRMLAFTPEPDALLHDFAFSLPQDLLRKVDTASMSCALEVRTPLLAREVVDAALAEPLSSLMPHNQRKGLLRAVARRYLPGAIVDRPKMGFAIPIGEWFRSDYGARAGGGGGLRTMLLDHLNSAEPFGPPSLGIDLNMAFIRRMLDEHLGTGMSGVVRRDHGQRLYMLLVLSVWAKWAGGLSKS